MTWEANIAAFIIKARDRQKKIFDTLVELTFRSIVHGSSDTGALGQPVDTGALKSSWQIVYLGDFEAAIITAQSYAPIIEDRTQPFKSEVGGADSVKVTRGGFHKLVERAVSIAI